MTIRKLLLAVGYWLFAVSSSWSQTPAFPTAEGFGKYASGGRGGKVVEVTTLADSGEGSLRWALTEAGKEDATIVFRVSGIIDIGPNPQRKGERAIRAKLRNVTIAGQTAPGEGILLRGGKLNLGGSENVIIRNIRARLGVLELEREEGESDATYRKRCFIEGGAIGIENARNIIIDHCCFGWSGEENVTMYDNHYTTLQWCIVHEGLYNAGHKKGVRGYGAQWGGSPATFHHNLLVHNDSRSARLNGATNPKADKNVFLEYQNNVNYNWGRRNSCYGGENEAGEGSTHECNFVGNYYKPGPAHPDDNVLVELSQARKGKTLTGPSLWYFHDNVMEGQRAKDNWTLVGNKTGFSVEQMRCDEPLAPAEYADYLTPAESARKAYRHVLAKAGTIHRDAVERRLVADVKSGRPRYQGASAHKPGIIDAPADADGWPVYAAATPAVDNDHDGMADDWEQVHGLNPQDPQDGRRVVTKEGYTALEVYLNSLMGEVVCF
jgi:pectate lyase